MKLRKESKAMLTVSLVLLLGMYLVAHKENWVLQNVLSSDTQRETLEIGNEIIDEYKEKGWYTEEKQSSLTLSTLKELAKKGENLTWSDFEGYTYEEIGSGLYIRAYAVGEKYILSVGGPSLNEKPMYIYLALKSNVDVRVDIRYSDVDAFVDLNS